MATDTNQANLAVPTVNKEDDYVIVPSSQPTDITDDVKTPVKPSPLPTQSSRGINWIDKFSGVSHLPGDPALNKEAIVNSYIATKLQGLPQEFIDRNPDAVKEVYAQDYLHLPGTNHTSEQLYDAIGKNIGVDETVKRNAELPAWTLQYTHPSDGGPAYSGEFNKALPPIQFNKFFQSLTKPMMVLPDAPKDLPSHPEWGVLDPQVLGGAWNGIKPLVEDLTSPAAVTAAALLPELAAAAITYPVAAGVLYTLKSGFAVMSYVSAANQTPEVKKVLNDPKSTRAQKSAVLARQIGTLASGIIMNLGLLPDGESVRPTGQELEVLPLTKELPSAERPVTPAAEIPTPETPSGPVILSTVTPGSYLTPLKSEPILTVNDLKGLSVKDSIAALSWAAANAPSAADAHVYQQAHDSLLPLAVDIPGEPPATNEPYQQTPVKTEEKPAVIGEIQQEPGSLAEASKSEIDETRNQIREIQDALEAIVEPLPDEFRMTPDDSPKPLSEEEKTQLSQIEEVQKQDTGDITQLFDTETKINELTEDTNTKVQNVFDALNEALDLAGAYEDTTIARTRTKYTALEKAKLQTKEAKLKLKETVAKLRSVLGDKIANIELNMDWQLAKQKYFLKKAAQEKIKELQDEHKQEIIDLKAKHQDQLSDLRYRKNDQIDIIRSEASDRYAALQAQSKEKLSNLIGLDKQGKYSYDVLRRALLDVANRLPADSRGKFLAAITDALRRPMLGRDPEGMFAKTYALTWKMMLELDKVEKQNLVDKINKTIKDSLDSPSVDVVAKQRIKQALARVLDKDPQASVDAYANDPESDNPAMDLANFNVEMISQTAAKDLPKSVLQSLADRVEMLQQAGKRLVKFRKYQFQALQDQLQEKILEGPANPINKVIPKQVYGIGASPAEKFKIGIRNAIAQNTAWIQNGNRQFITSDVMANYMEGVPKDNYGQLSRYLKGTLDLGHNARLNLYSQLTKPVRDVLTKYGEFTKDESYRIGIYAIAQNENGLQRLKDSGISLTQATDIRLTNKEASMYIALRNVMDNSILPMLMKTYRTLNNQELVPEKNYWPFIKDYSRSTKVGAKLVKEQAGEAVDIADEIKNNDTMLQLMQDITGFRTKKTPQGFLQERTPDAIGAVKLDGIEVALRHINQAAHYISQQSDLTMLANIVGNKKFAAKYGDVGQKYWLDVLDSVARDADPSTATRWTKLDSLVRNVNVGEIGWRLLSQLKHLPNTAITLANMSPDIFAYALDQLNEPGVNEYIMKNYAEIATRKGSEVDYDDVINKGFFKKINKNSFFLEAALDQMHGKVAVLGSTIQQMRDRGMDWKNYLNLPLNPDIQKQALRVAREAVNSTLRKDLPLAISRGTIASGNMSLARAITAFQGTMYKNYSLMSRDIYHKGFKQKDYKQLFKSVLTWSMVLGGVAGIAYGDKKIYQYMFGAKEPEGYWKEVANEGTRLLPVSSLILPLYNNATGIPAIDIIRDYRNTVYSLATNKNNYGKPLSPKQREKLFMQLASDALVLKGLGGAGQISRILKPAATGSKVDSNVRNIVVPLKDNN